MWYRCVLWSCKAARKSREPSNHTHMKYHDCMILGEIFWFVENIGILRFILNSPPKLLIGWSRHAIGSLLIHLLYAANYRVTTKVIVDLLYFKSDKLWKCPQNFFFFFGIYVNLLKMIISKQNKCIFYWAERDHIVVSIKQLWITLCLLKWDPCLKDSSQIKQTLHSNGFVINLL